MEDSSLSNDALTSTANGFLRGDVELRTPYYKPFFDSLLSMWDTRSIGMATRIVRGLYPRSLYNYGSAEGTRVSDNPSVALAQEWLHKNPSAPSALRRLILEAQDNAHRNMIGQQFNSSLSD